MMEVLIFFLKALIVVGSIGSIIILIAVISAKKRNNSKLKIENLHEQFEDYEDHLKHQISTEDELKAQKKSLKAKHKAEKKSPPNFAKAFVLNFDGDIKASAVESLREEVTAVLQVARAEDKVIVKIKSPGGVVHGYGLAASQLIRIKQAKIPLIACVDEVAASGGYMMASVCDKIIAAPFAILGSIGVVAQVPNFNRLLKKHEVDYKEYTAGEVKRTVSVFGEITAKGEAHFQQKLSDVHQLFKNHVSTHRPQVDLNKVADGDHWFGQEALELKLVDELATSDEYLMNLYKNKTHLYSVEYEVKETLMDKIPQLLGRVLNEFTKVLTRQGTPPEKIL